MSSTENSPLPNNALPEQVLTVPPLGPIGYALPPQWSAAGPAEPLRGVSIASYLHAVRRHWLLALSSGLACAVLLALSVWLWRVPQYTAVASLLLQPTTPQVAFPTRDTQMEMGAGAFDVYRETQKHLIKNPFVLTAALRDPSVKGLPSIQREEQRHNALAWLKSELSADFPTKNAQVMEVSMTGPDRDEAANLVNAVVRAYFDEVVLWDQNQRKVKLVQLQQACAEKENEVRSKRTELRQLADQLQTTDTETLTLKQKLAVEQFGEYRRELNLKQWELVRARGHQQAQQALLERLESIEIPEAKVYAMAQLDPQYRPLAERSMWARMSSDLTRANAVPGAAPAYVQTRDRDLQMILGQSEELLKGYREKIRAADRADIQKELRRLEAEVAILADQKQQLEKDVEEKRKEAEQVGRNSIDVQMMLSEVRHLEQVFSSMVDERERLQVELRGASRVRIIGDVERPAEVPQNESNRPMRLALIFFGGLVGFCLPVLGIAVWDVQAGRINGAWEVAQGLGLRVLGSVPMIPARVLRQLAAPTKRNQTWRVRLTESVDGLVARLLRKAEQEQSRVLLVSSAMPGEGKTTLATQLAMSLVRNLRRTVLVDFDLRRPALGGLFGLPAEPGVCEALRGQGDVLDMIHATDSDSPAILTAGRWDRQVLAALGNGAAGALIERLRAHYDFVVIDSSPILPIADTRLVSQQVDTVILSVFRDKSQTARVLAAAEILEAFGVRSIEVVVTGGQELCYGRDSGYQPLAEFEPEVPQPPAAETDAT